MGAARAFACSQAVSLTVPRTDLPRAPGDLSLALLLLKGINSASPTRKQQGTKALNRNGASIANTD